MPSPFPGMDPYLENPLVWPGFHNSLADEIQRVLNRVLPAPYYADLEARSEIGLVDEPPVRDFVPDVSVRRTSSNGGPADADGGVAVAEPRVTVSESVQFVFESEPVNLYSVRVRDQETHQVITLIEILSPSNKRPGRDRSRFLKKRNDVLQSNTSLVEIDLLRTGSRMWIDPDVTPCLSALRPPPDYVVMLSRAWERDDEFRLQAFCTTIDRPLPVISIPLREGDPEVTFDLQFAFRTVYDSGPYRRGKLNYAEPPTPPLTGEWQEWAAERVRGWQPQ